MTTFQSKNTTTGNLETFGYVVTSVLTKVEHNNENLSNITARRKVPVY
jgi:hypothetical protein